MWQKALRICSTSSMIVSQFASFPWRFEDTRYSLIMFWWSTRTKSIMALASGDACTKAAYLLPKVFHGLASPGFGYCYTFFTQQSKQPVAVDSAVQSHLKRDCESLQSMVTSSHWKEIQFVHLTFTQGFWSGYVLAIGFARFKLRISKSLYAQYRSLQETSAVWATGRTCL
jgi:hypothetical protein